MLGEPAPPRVFFKGVCQNGSKQIHDHCPCPYSDNAQTMPTPVLPFPCGDLQAVAARQGPGRGEGSGRGSGDRQPPAVGGCTTYPLPASGTGVEVELRGGYNRGTQGTGGTWATEGTGLLWVLVIHGGTRSIRSPWGTQVVPGALWVLGVVPSGSWFNQSRSKSQGAPSPLRPQVVVAGAVKGGGLVATGLQATHRLGVGGRTVGVGWHLLGAQGRGIALAHTAVAAWAGAAPPTAPALPPVAVPAGYHDEEWPWLPQPKNQHQPRP